jgi:hypothetical protein
VLCAGVQAQATAPTTREAAEVSAGDAKQRAASIAEMDQRCDATVQALVAARKKVIDASLAWPADPSAIKRAVAEVGVVELQLGTMRAKEISRLQLDYHLSDKEVARIVAGWRAGQRSPQKPISDFTSSQASALTEATRGLPVLVESLTERRAALIAATVAASSDDAAIKAAVDAVIGAEQALADARAAGFARVQNSSQKLSTAQIAALAQLGGALVSGGFSEPSPYDFNDHDGYMSLFDGVSLKGWSGNPKFWRVENGAIVGQSTKENPSGNSYLVYRDVKTRDFTLKFEMRIDGDGGSGLQYRSQTGVPWLSGISKTVTDNVGPVNLDWMMTGPQADFWPAKVYSGQFYSENTPMRIMAWRGQVVEAAGTGPRRLMGTIGDRKALGELVKANDWNQYIVIARGGTFIHIINGQVMAVLVDDDPTSTNNQPGQFGIEIEAITKVSVKDIWLKKMD